VCKWCRGGDLFEPIDESLNFNDADDQPSVEEEE
jgi:hypothetical protein